jgi:hypothetical protein
MSKSIITATAVIAMTVLFGYFGAAMLEAETGRKILTAIAATIALVVLAEVAHAVIDRWRGRAV